jgi:precorrin-6B methylase 1
LVGPNSQPIFDFYSPDYDIPKHSRVPVAVVERLTKHREEVDQFLAEHPGEWWVVNLHAGGRFSKLVRQLRERRERLVTCEGDGAEALLFDAAAP